MSSTYIPVSLHSGAVSDRACSTCTRNRRHSVYRDSPPVDEGGLGVPGNDSGSDRGAIEGSGPRAGVATVHVVGQWPGSSKGGVGPGGVEALGVAGGAVAEREAGVDEVPVAVGGDGGNLPD